MLPKQKVTVCATFKVSNVKHCCDPVDLEIGQGQIYEMQLKVLLLFAKHVHVLQLVPDLQESVPIPETQYSIQEGGFLLK